MNQLLVLLLTASCCLAQILTGSDSLDIGSESSGFGAYSSGSGSYSSDIGSESSGFGAYSSGSGSYSSDIGSESSGFGSESSGSGSYSSDIGSESSGFGSESAGSGSYALASTYEHNAECHGSVPKDLYIPTACYVYAYAEACENLGYDSNDLEDFKQCAYDNLPAEEMHHLEEMWYSSFGPGGQLVNKLCGKMGYDLDYLDHYAVCLEHVLGTGHNDTNAAYLGAEIYDLDYSLGPDLPADPMEKIFAVLHGIAVWFLPGYNMCPYDEYMCSDMSCIPGYFKCDIMADCKDATDELFCGGYHESEPYDECMMIKDEQWCDGHPDCSYDEEWCDEYSEYSEDPWYTCELADDQWCNGIRDCRYDEADWCDKYDWSRWDEYKEDPYFQCEIEIERFCDGKQDCAFDEDPRYCEEDTWLPSSSSYSYPTIF